jgi:hypothetical protein
MQRRSRRERDAELVTASQIAAAFGVSIFPSASIARTRFLHGRGRVREWITETHQARCVNEVTVPKPHPSDVTRDPRTA